MKVTICWCAQIKQSAWFQYPQYFLKHQPKHRGMFKTGCRKYNIKCRVWSWNNVRILHDVVNIGTSLNIKSYVISRP